MKSALLLKAIGNISDIFIEEAEIKETAESVEYAAAKEPLPLKKGFRARLAVYVGALAALAFAAFFLLLKIAGGKGIYIGELLPSSENIANITLSSEFFDARGINPDPIADEKIKEEITGLFYGMNHEKCSPEKEITEFGPLSDYTLSFGYSDGRRAEIRFFGDIYFLGFGEEAYSFKGSGEEYNRLIRLMGEYIYDIRTAWTAESAYTLDGYAADALIAGSKCVLKVVFPSGRTSSAEINPAELFSEDLLMSSLIPQTVLFRFEQKGVIEYAAMVRTVYMDGRDKAVFYVCDKEKEELVPYALSENGEEVKALSVSDTVHHEKGASLCDKRLDRNIEFDILSRTAKTAEFSSWEQEISLSDFSAEDKKHFETEELNMDGDSEIEGAISGDTVYYYQSDFSMSREGPFTGRIVAHNMVTGEKETLIEGEATIWKRYVPLGVYGDCLYYLFREAKENEAAYICKIRLTDKSCETLYRLGSENPLTAPTKKGIYFGDVDGRTGAPCVYFLDFGDDSVKLCLKNVNDFAPYRDGVVYAYGGSVYYRGKEEIFCQEVMENGDRKLFQTEDSRSGISEKFYARGDCLIFVTQYDGYDEDMTWFNLGSTVLLYDENAGLKPIFTSEKILFTDILKGKDYFIKINDSFYNVENGTLYSIVFPFPEPGNTALDWDIEINCSEGVIYCMLYRYDMSEEDDKRVDRRFYRLTQGGELHSDS